MREPIPHGAKPFRNEAIAAFSAMPLLAHQARIEQDAEVLRDGRAAHLEMSSNRVDRAVGPRDEIEHPSTRGMANRIEYIGCAMGRHDHAGNIRKELLTCQAIL